MNNPIPVSYSSLPSSRESIPAWMGGRIQSPLPRRDLCITVIPMPREESGVGYSVRPEPSRRVSRTEWAGFPAHITRSCAKVSRRDRARVRVRVKSPSSVIPKPICPVIMNNPIPVSHSSFPSSRESIPVWMGGGVQSPSPLGNELSNMQCMFDSSNKTGRGGGGENQFIPGRGMGGRFNPLLSPSTKLEGRTCATVQLHPSVFSPLGNDIPKMRRIFGMSIKQGGWAGTDYSRWVAGRVPPLPPSTKLEGRTCAGAQVRPSVFLSPSPLMALRERGIKGVRIPPWGRGGSFTPSTELEGHTCAKAQVCPSVFLSPSPLMALRERGIKGVRVPLPVP